MAEVIIMPKLGFNMNEGKLVEWYKAEGDAIKKGEPLFSIETDKTNMDVEATRDGVVLKLFIGAGDTLPVTLPIAIVGDSGENIDAVIADCEAQLGGSAPAPAAKEEAAPAKAEAPKAAAPAPKADGGRIKISPRARRIAQENDIAIDAIEIAGTGWDGGISEQDILDYIESNKVKATPVAKAMADAEGIDLASIKGTGVNGKIMKSDVEAAVANKAKAPAAAEECTCCAEEISPDGKKILEKVPYAGVRKVIGDRLSESKFTAPHLYFTQKVNLEKLLAFRKQVNEAQDHKVSVTDFIVRAAIISLQKYPDINSSLVDGNIVKYKSCNVGVAVAAPSGLIVPNVKDGQDLTLVELSKESARLVKKARDGKLAMSEYTGGTFSVSNLGMFGIENFTAIINPPESAILSVSSTKDEAWVVTGPDGKKELAIKPVMNIQLTVDHRIIDGLLAAQFVTEIKTLLENPVSLVL